MRAMFDKRPIEIYESYIGYGDMELKKMTVPQLRKAIEKIDKKLEADDDELERAISNKVSDYAIKEDINNLLWDRKLLEEELGSRPKEERNEKIEESVSVKPKKHIFKTFFSN